MKFKATKIATAVATGLGLSVAGMSAANADSILFPHFVMSPTVTTVMSVMNDDVPVETLRELHYRYYYKNVATNTANPADLPNNRACVEYDFWNPTSPNDIVTFDIGDYSGFNSDENGVLFETGSTTVKYVDSFAALANANTSNAPIRGYVLVENNPRNEGAPTPAPSAKLSGDAIVIEFITGSAWGYEAVNSSGIYSLVNGNLVELNRNDFSDAVETGSEILATPPAGVSPADQKKWFWAPISVLPWDDIQSGLFVTAVSDNMGTNRGYNVSANLQLRAAASGSDRIMFNRDERAYSGPGAASVTCVGRVNVRDMVGEVVRQSTPQGGWTNITLTAGQAIVFKGDINDGTAQVFQVADGTFNNVNMLRKGIRETQLNAAGNGRPVLQNGWTFLPIYNIAGVDNNAPFPVLQGITNLNQLYVNSTPQQRRFDPNIVYNQTKFAAPAVVQNALNQGRVFSIDSSQDAGEVINPPVSRAQ